MNFKDSLKEVEQRDQFDQLQYHACLKFLIDSTVGVFENDPNLKRCFCNLPFFIER